MQNNLRPSTYYDSSNLQHVYANSHTSAIPEVHIPMNDVMSSVNKYETPNVINFNIMQNSFSPFYSSANNLQYFGSPSHTPMDRTIDHATNYSQPSHGMSYVTNF
jgi:hypothetical protein